MNKLWLYIFCLIAFAGCTKNNPLPPLTATQNIPKSTLQATGGTNQTDTAGRALLDSIIVKINEPGSPLNKYLIQIFQKTLCNGDSIIQKSISNGSSISYQWRLNSSPGVQTLKFKVLDTAKKTIDSINVTATALPPSHGWHVSACLINKNLYLRTFAKMSNGRLLAGFDGNFYPYYSDDNGITWHPLTSFYFGFYPWVEKIIVLPSDEIFIGSEIAGIYYSADKGNTWTLRGQGIPPLTPIIDFVSTPDGRLIYTSNAGGMYISYDQGLNWKTIQDNQINVSSQPKYMGMQSNGDIYFTINLDPFLVKLDHTTLSLSPVANLPTITVNAFYIDKNGNMYAGGSDINGAKLYQSTDNGTTWLQVFSYPKDTGTPITPTIANISSQSDGNYYFEVLTNFGIYFKTADFKTIQSIPADAPAYSGQYIVAANNNFLMNSFPLSIWYYVP